MPESALADTEARSWTCDRCDMTVQWLPGHGQPDRDLPPNWERDGDLEHCLACRRDLAAEGAEMPEDTPLSERVKLQSHARIEFEVQRAPDRANGEIAKACRSSAAAVQKARVRLGLVDG